MGLQGLNFEEGYWESFLLTEIDIEFIYDYLLEQETPLSPEDMLNILVEYRIEGEIERIEKNRTNGSKSYLPKEEYQVGENISFPLEDWKVGEVVSIRNGNTYSDNVYKVGKVKFNDGSTQEYAFELVKHELNNPPAEEEVNLAFSAENIIEEHGDSLISKIVTHLKNDEDFVYIAGAWFPQALLVDVNEGNLVLADALLDIEGGGPLTTEQLLSQVGLPDGVNERLAKFSLDMALQNDIRFDEVGSTGEVLWYLKRHEPKEVLEVPLWLASNEIEYDHTLMNSQMLAFESKLGDELSPINSSDFPSSDKHSISLIFPHWRSGTLPLSAQIEDLFPSAYESPRIRLLFVDKKTGEKFSGWVIRLEKYIYGLKEWYSKVGAIPGSIIYLEKGDNPGEIIVSVEPHISSKEWVRTALIGADGKIVYANLKQAVSTSFDDRMVIAMPAGTELLDEGWEARKLNPLSLEQVMVSTLRELSKLSPQGHVHAAELYSAVNMIMRCPPAQIFVILESRPWFKHVGDLHYRYEEAE